MWKQTFECSSLNEPDFEDDPSGWFDWYDDCASGADPVAEPPQPPSLPPCRPRHYTVNGKCWEVVCTNEGPEIRPCLKTPVPPNLTAIEILAIRIANDGFHVQTLSKGGLLMEKIKHGKIKLKHLGAAMIFKQALPELSIKKIKPDFWQKLKPLPKKQKTIEK